MSKMEKNTLEAMPDVAIERILKDCNYADIQSLRKSCSRLRGLVDLLKPNPKVKQINCRLSPRFMLMHLVLSDGQSAEVYYKAVDGGCTVATGKQEWDFTGRRFFANTTIASMILQDFKIVKDSLVHQPTPLEKCRIRIHGRDLSVFQDSIGVSCAELPQLRITSLRIDLDDCRHFPSILPLVSSDELRRLRIVARREPQHIVNINEITQLDHWRSIRILKFRDFPINDLSIIASVPNSEIQLHIISPEQAIWLKETFRNSQTFEHCSVRFEYDCRVLMTRAIIFGDEAVDDPYDDWETIWFFTSPRPGKVFKVYYFMSLLQFSLADVAEVDEEDRVYD